MQVVICDRCGRALGTTAAQVNIYKAFRGETKMHVCKKCEIKLREWNEYKNGVEKEGGV